MYISSQEVGSKFYFQGSRELLLELDFHALTRAEQVSTNGPHSQLGTSYTYQRDRRPSFASNFQAQCHHLHATRSAPTLQHLPIYLLFPDVFLHPLFPHSHLIHQTSQACLPAFALRPANQTLPQN